MKNTMYAIFCQNGLFCEFSPNFRHKFFVVFITGTFQNVVHSGAFWYVPVRYELYWMTIKYVISCVHVHSRTCTFVPIRIQMDSNPRTSLWHNFSQGVALPSGQLNVAIPFVFKIILRRVILHQTKNFMHPKIQKF